MKTQFWRKKSNVIVKMQLNTIKQAFTKSIKAYSIRVMNLIELNRLDMIKREKIYYFAKEFTKILDETCL